MALTQITPDVLDVSKTSIRLVDDLVAGGLRDYIDSSIANIPPSTGTPNAVRKIGDTMTGFLTLNATPTAALHASTKGYVDSSIVGKLNKAGDTMTGALVVNAAVSAGGLFNAWAGATVSGAPLTVNDITIFNSKVQAKTGANTVNNTNSCGYVFNGDIDTGMFSPTTGKLHLVENGTAVLTTSPANPIAFSKQIRVPKGLPNATNTSYTGGYAFASDGDTGLFAVGGSDTTGSDLVLTIDNAIVARFKSQTASGSTNGWARLSSGIIFQWFSVSVYDTGVTVATAVTFPITFNNTWHVFTEMGNGLNALAQASTFEGITDSGGTLFTYASTGWRTYRMFAIGN